MIHVYLNYLTLKQIWEKRAVCSHRAATSDPPNVNLRDDDVTDQRCVESQKRVKLKTLDICLDKVQNWLTLILC